MSRIHLFLEPEDVALLAKDMKSRGYVNRSRFFRDLLQGNLKPQKSIKKVASTSSYVSQQSPWLMAFYEVTGRHLQKDLQKNALAAERIHGIVRSSGIKHEAAQDGLTWLLKVVGYIRADKYAGKHLLMATSSYVQIEKHLDSIIDYALQKIAQKEHGGKVNLSGNQHKLLKELQS